MKESERATAMIHRSIAHDVHDICRATVGTKVRRLVPSVVLAPSYNVTPSLVGRTQEGLLYSETMTIEAASLS